jgi:trehalose-6-phosphate synthase
MIPVTRPEVGIWSWFLVDGIVHINSITYQLKNYTINFSKYVSKINILQQAFDSRFSEYKRGK